MSLDGVALVGGLLASVPAVNVIWNLFLYRSAPRSDEGSVAAGKSLLIPARDEEANIRSTLEAARSNPDRNLEILVMDDHSRDRTAEIVRELAARDARVRLISTPELPSGWCGKQHACQRLAEKARRDYLVFMDADVRLQPDALGRMVRFLQRSGRDLASGIPRQETKTWMEKLVVPLIHFVLLGFLPVAAMRRRQGAAWAAGCGQLIVARREAYEAAGGHHAIRSSRHDGLMLPRAFRRAGRSTDLFDATDLATCRMYRTAREVWTGFAKNATEGMASPTAILPWTLLLFGGQILPPLLVVVGLAAPGAVDLAYASAATALVYAPRLLLAARFRQSLVGALWHPLGVAVVLAIQWFALGRSIAGRPLAWRGRT